MILRLLRSSIKLKQKGGNTIQDRLVHVTTDGEREKHRIVVPEGLKQSVLTSYHDEDGHGDASRTLQKIQQRYFWGNMNRDVEEYVRGCQTCQRYNAQTGTQTGSLNPRMPRQAPFNTIAMDHVGPIHTEDTNKYFITAVDVTTRFIITRAVPDKSTEHVLRFLDEDILFTFGTPKTVITDNDRVFTSRAATRYFTERSIHHRLTVPYAPETNGLVERANAKILSALRKNLNGNMDHWSEYLKETTFQVNNQPHVGLHMSPFQLLYNYVPRRTIDNELSAPTELQDQTEDKREEARSTLTDYLHELKRKYDAKHKPPSFNVGDEVWYHKGTRPTKLGPMYDGPYTITSVEKETYTISKKGTEETRLATARQLKHLHTQPDFNETHSQATCEENTTDSDEPGQVQARSDTCSKPPLNEGEQMPSRTADDQPRRKKPPRWLEDYVTEYCEDAID